MTGKYDEYNTRMVDHLRDVWLEPPDGEEQIHECCMCNHEAEYEVMGDYYCEVCLHAEFRL